MLALMMTITSVVPLETDFTSMLRAAEANSSPWTSEALVLQLHQGAAPGLASRIL